MAKNTKGDGSLEQNGSTVVTPDNTGKGLAYNAQTNQYDVSLSNSVQIINNEIGVKVSPDEGNLLELRDNGVYYGVKAVQQDFFVDAVTGNDDTGDGSYTTPYRTLNKALSAIPPQKKKFKDLLARGTEP